MATENPLIALANSRKDELSPVLEKSPVSWEDYTLGLSLALASNPKLAVIVQKNPRSALAALMQAAQLGLSPAPDLGHYYLVPFGDRITPLLGYRGMIHLAERSEKLGNIASGLIYKGNQKAFVFNQVTGEITPPPFTFDDDEMGRSDECIVGAWATAEVHGRNHPVSKVLLRSEILKRRDRGGASRAGKSSPWVTDFPAMCHKTVIRALLNDGRVPRGPQVSEAERVDDEAEQMKEAEVVVVGNPSDGGLDWVKEQFVNGDTPPPIDKDGDLEPMADIDAKAYPGEEGFQEPESFSQEEKVDE